MPPRCKRWPSAWPIRSSTSRRSARTSSGSRPRRSSRGSTTAAGRIRAAALAMADNSNSQFALLALHEAERIGVPVKRETWTRAKAYWEDCQNPLDGSWGYRKGIQRHGHDDLRRHRLADHLQRPLPPVQRQGRGQPDPLLSGRRRRRRRPHPTRPGLAGPQLHRQRQPGHARTTLATLLSLRPGTRRPPDQPAVPLRPAPASRTTGTAAAPSTWSPSKWPSATRLLDRQGLRRGRQDRSAPRLALLFMSKGRRPILMAKCQHSVEDDWNPTAATSTT